MSKIKYDLPCNLAQTLNLIGEKWTMLILFNILEPTAHLSNTVAFGLEIVL